MASLTATTYKTPNGKRQTALEREREWRGNKGHPDNGRTTATIIENKYRLSCSCGLDLLVLYLGKPNDETTMPSV